MQEKKTTVIPLVTASESGTDQTESPEKSGGDVVCGPHTASPKKVNTSGTPSHRA